MIRRPMIRWGMILWEIIRFEIGYQSRRASTWLYFGVLLTLIFYLTSELPVDYARVDGSFANGPFIVAVMSLLGSVVGLVIASALAGEAGARDAQTRMDPLLYTAPVGKTAYLAGRFLAAFGLYAAILLAVPLGLLLAAYGSSQTQLLGPFRPEAYLGAYLFLLLPNAFVATAVLFSLAALSRRAIVSYLGALLLVGACTFALALAVRTPTQWALAKLLDPLGAVVLSELSMVWTSAERSTRLIGLQGALLSNRVLWIGLAFGVLTLTHVRFRLAHHTPGGGRTWSRAAVRGPERLDRGVSFGDTRGVHAAPQVRRTFGVATRVHQVLAVASDSFHALARSWGALILLATAAFLAYSGTPIAHMGVPLFATTERIIAFLAAPMTSPEEINGMIVPLLIILYAGELVWRDRDAGSHEIADVIPAPDWVLLLGRFAGLSLVIVTLQALVMAAGMLTQALLGHHDFQIALYVQTLFGLRLADYLLFALLALVIHVLVNHKYVGHLVGVIAYAFMAFGPAVGVDHHLLLYGSDPGWTYSDMRGFEPFLGPWLWFKLYWTAWALLLAVVARLLWVRGKEAGLGARLALARRRLTRRTAGVLAAAVALVLTIGGFIFYNTNVRHAYQTPADSAARRVDYERRYGQYRDVPQPQLTGTRLHVQIHPRRRQAEIRGTFTLVNNSASAIDAIHLAPSSLVETTAIRFDRPTKDVLADERLGHRIYTLQTPLDPGASLRLDFELRFAPRGFSNRGVDASVVSNGTYFTNGAWLPAIGYQAGRELQGAGARRAYGLVERPMVRGLDDDEARHDRERTARTAFEAIVGTDEGQVAVAPGRLRRTWTENGRRYFHYATDAPIRNDYAFFSAAYAVREGRWHAPSAASGQDVAIQILHHPAHAWNAERMVRSVQASLDYYTREFGAYPHGQVRFVEHPGSGIVLHAAPINVAYDEGFSLLHPEADARHIDLPFAVVAHEMAHQWWGNRLVPADVEGAAVLSETLAWYSALGVVEQALGRDHLHRLLSMMREAYLTPRARANVPLLRARDQFLAYRKGPFAMYALREYVGAEAVNAALRRLLETHGSAAPPLPTSLDLYRELQAATPQSLRSLLADLFEANTFWELTAEQATTAQAASGLWDVTLDVRARKVTVDPDGVETEIPMDDEIEVGVFADAKEGLPGEPLYLRRHRVRSGPQRITLSVPGKPARAGIDPRSLLIDVDAADNLAEIGAAPTRGNRTFGSASGSTGAGAAPDGRP